MPRKPNNIRYQSRRTERGAQLAELAIVMPIFVLLLAGVAEYGLYFYTYTTLDKATRLAARYITSVPYNPNDPTNPNNSIAKAKNLAVCGSISACSAGSEIITGLSTSNISITTTGPDAFFPQTITVQISGYNYQSLFNLGAFTGGDSWLSIAVSPGTTMRYTLEN